MCGSCTWKDEIELKLAWRWDGDVGNGDLMGLNVFVWGMSGIMLEWVVILVAVGMEYCRQAICIVR